MQTKARMSCRMQTKVPMSCPMQRMFSCHALCDEGSHVMPYAKEGSYVMLYATKVPMSCPMQRRFPCHALCNEGSCVMAYATKVHMSCPICKWTKHKVINMKQCFLFRIHFLEMAGNCWLQLFFWGWHDNWTLIYWVGYCRNFVYYHCRRFICGSANINIDYHLLFMVNGWQDSLNAVRIIFTVLEFWRYITAFASNNSYLWQSRSFVRECRE